MNKIDKKILIIGSSAKEYSLAKKILELPNVSEVFVAPGSDSIKEICSIVDIRENNPQELLEFVLENAIDFTIAASEKAVRADVATVFHQNGQMIFAPTAQGADICLSKSTGKKFMYKARISCPQFAIFDKLQMAVDYVLKRNIPLVIKTDEHQDGKGVLVSPSASASKVIVENLFDMGEKRVIIEDFIKGHEFSFYVITDGYHALPLGSVATYKHDLEGNGGAITSGMGSFSPDYKISSDIENKIMHQIIYPALNLLERDHAPYIGILGVDLIIDDNEYLYAIEFNHFLQTPDCQSILALMNENILNLMQACAVGSFADDYHSIEMEDACAISLVIKGSKRGEIIEGLDSLDDDIIVSHFNTKKNEYLEYETDQGPNLVLTQKSKGFSRALDNLYDNAALINFSGIKYRKDIGKI